VQPARRRATASPARPAAMAGAHAVVQRGCIAASSALTSLLPRACPTGSPCGDTQCLPLRVPPRTPEGVWQRSTAGVPAPRREAGPPRCPTVPGSRPRPPAQLSEAPSHRIPTPHPSPPQRSHQTGLKVNNSLPRPGAGSGRERPRRGARGGRGRRAEPRRQHRAMETTPVAHTVGDEPPAASSLRGAVPKSKALLQLCFPCPQHPLLRLPCPPPRRLRRSPPRCSELAASPRRVPSCPARSQGTEGALYTAGVPVTAGPRLRAGANPGGGLGTRPRRFFRAGIHRRAGSAKPAPACRSLARQRRGVAGPLLGTETDMAVWDERRWETRTGLGR